MPKQDEIFGTGPSGGLMITEYDRSESDDEVILHVYDTSNDQSYDLPFLRHNSVFEVKCFVGELTGIQLEEQEWSGWPDETTDERMLNELELDQAFHSLVIWRADGEENGASSNGSLKGAGNQGEINPLSESEAPPEKIPNHKVIKDKNALLKCKEGSKEVHCQNIDLQPSSKRPRTDVTGNSISFSPYVLPDLEKKLSNKILQYLSPLEQLSLRRACKTTNAWVNRKQKDITPEEENKWKAHQVVITGRGLKTFGTVIKMGLPITKYTFDVDGESFYEDEKINTFLSNVGLRVKDVTLQRFYMFQNLNEHRMLEAFVNLEKLTLNNLVESEEHLSHPPNTCPSTLKNLQVLKCNYEVKVPQNNQLIRPLSWNLTWGMLHDCEKLSYFRFPLAYEEIPDNSASAFAPLMEYLEERQSCGDTSLKTLDLKNLNDGDSFYATLFLELLQNCHAKGITFKNVSSELVHQMLTEDGKKRENDLGFCDSIVSLINFQHFMEMIPLPNLEKIIIDVVPSATDLCTAGRSYTNQVWPKLQTIKIKDTFFGWNQAIQLGWERIEKGLYSGIITSGKTSVNYIAVDSPALPYFLSESPRFADKFRNVTKLRISSWFDVDEASVLNKRLVSIWDKLRLVELHIERCPKLNDHSFIGSVDDRSVPSFLKLAESLKTFALDLDDTSITDLVFIHVFSQMTLKVFKLLSTQPVHISEEALLTLMNGEFGKNIERFPFDRWTSSVITPDRFVQLGKEFRSMC